jgi:hypothetical protein
MAYELHVYVQLISKRTYANIEDSETSMPPIILLPLAYAGLRLAASAAIRKKVAQGIGESTVAAISQISRTLIVSLFEISINILLFLAIIYFSGSLFDFQTSMTIICSIYVGSLAHSISKVIKNFNFMLLLGRDYRLNLKRFIYEQIYQNVRSEAQKTLDGMGLIKRIAYKVSAGPGADTIALRVARGAMPLIWKRVSARLLAILITMLLYILIFRMIVAPFLIRETAHFSLLQALLWPFAFSIDFFFHTTFSSRIASLG